jgi:hypothetical protein
MSPPPLMKGDFIQFTKYGFDNIDNEYIEDTFHGEIYEVGNDTGSPYRVFVKEKRGAKMDVKLAEIKHQISKEKFWAGFTPNPEYYINRRFHLPQLELPSSDPMRHLDGKRSRRKPKSPKKRSKRSKKFNYSKWTSCETCKTCSKCKAKFAKMGQTMWDDFPKIGWLWKRSRKNKA